MKKIIAGVIIGGIVFALGGVIAATTISSQNVTYQNKTVNSALDELYNNAVTGKELVAAAITNKGVSTTSNDTYETMATNINSIDTDHSEIIEKINNLENKINGSGTVATLGYATKTGVITLSDDINNYSEIYLAAYVGSENSFVDVKKIPLKLFKLKYNFYVNYNANTGVVYSASATYVSDKKVSITYLSSSANFSFYIYGYK